MNMNITMVMATSGLVVFSVSIFHLVVGSRFQFSQERVRKSLNRKKAIQRLTNRIIRKYKELSKSDKLMIVSLSALMLMLAPSLNNLSVLTTLLLFGMAFGVFIVVQYKKSRRQIRKMQVLKDCALLADSVELAMKTGGHTVKSALEMYKNSTHHIRRDIEYALVYWPAGAEKALDVLKERLYYPETEGFFLLLVSLEKRGTQFLQDSLSREALRIEEMQEAAARQSFAETNLKMVIWRSLPIMIFAALLIGGLLMKFAKTAMTLINQF